MLRRRRLLYTSILFILFINIAFIHIYLTDLWIISVNNLQKSRKTSGRETVHFSKLWFNSSINNDRIVEQMKFIPKSVLDGLHRNQTVPYKTIFIYNGNPDDARIAFTNRKCPVSFCKVTTNFENTNKADIVVTSRYGLRRPMGIPRQQVWVLWLLESPYNTIDFQYYKDVYNWTATYRHDSDIVTPYAKFVLHNARIRARKQTKNFAKGKTKKVAWFVSNCGSFNGRGEYVTELKRYIQVDIFGYCGKLKCPRNQEHECFEMLRKDYKFYLAFENSNCRDYITEKFFVNGLQNDVIPVVMGAAPGDYRRIAPYNSFIHVDDFQSPKHLSEYLHTLDMNDSLYNEYFQWKGTGSFINTMFWCRLCAMAHALPLNKTFFYGDIDKWWNKPGICVGDNSWGIKTFV